MNTPTPGTLARSWGFILYDTRYPLHFKLHCYSPVTMSDTIIETILKPYTLYETADSNKLAFKNRHEKIFSCERKSFHPAMFFSSRAELILEGCLENIEGYIHSTTIDPTMSPPISLDEGLALFDMGFAKSMFCTYKNISSPTMELCVNTMDVIRVEPSGIIMKYYQEYEDWMEVSLFAYLHSLQLFKVTILPTSM